MSLEFAWSKFVSHVHMQYTCRYTCTYVSTYTCKSILISFFLHQFRMKKEDFDLLISYWGKLKLKLCKPVRNRPMYIIHTFCANVISIQPRQKGVVNKSIHFLRPNFSIINPTTVHEAVAPNYTYKHTHTNVYNIRSQITTFYTFAFQRNFEESNFAHKTAFKVMHTKAIELIHVSSKSEISPILFLSLKSGRATDVQLRTDPKANDPKFAV